MQNCVAALRQVMRPLPCLVVCDPDNVQHWRYHFHLWTNSAQETVDDGTNRFSKKEIFITSINHITGDISRREWGIVVVDSSDAVSYLNRLKLLKAHFKVWLSSDNLLNNLQVLSTICELINPSNKLDPSAYSKLGLSRREQIEKDIELDIFCEDVLLRRTDEVALPNHKVLKELYDIWDSDRTINRDLYFKVTSGTSVNDASSPTETAIPTDAPKVAEATRKNKDATGLKIKRSKPTNGESNSVDGEQKRPRLVQFNKTYASKNMQECLIRRDFPGITLLRSRIIETLDCQTSLPEEKCTSLASNVETVGNHLEEKTVDCPTSLPEEKHTAPASILETVANNLEDTIIINNKDMQALSNSKKLETLKRESQTLVFKTSDIHSSVKRIEELANKQFKGSILDNLF